MGRVEKVKRRGGGMVEYEYDATGQVHRISGSGMMPRRFSYDPRGLCTSMKTFQGGLDGAGAVLTSWNYDHHSGRLKSKQINGITVEDYDYTPAGRLDKVTRYLPAGTVQTTYTRDASGAVVAITHSDASPGVTTIRDAKGRPAQVTDAVGTHTCTYNADDQVLSESLPQLPGGLLSHTYDASGRRTATALSLNGTTLVTWTAGYDSAGRLATVSDGHCAAGYGYLAGSNLVETITCTTDATDPRLAITRTYDTEDRLASILAEKPGTTPLTLARWDYSLDDDGRRTRTDVKLIDPTDATVLHAFHWDYAYDGLDQLAGATCRWDSTNAVIPGRDLIYDHDSISNRRTAGRLDPATAAGEEQYTVNDLNQYTARALPGAVHISGFADPAATVTVNNEPTTRDGAAFHLRLPVDNSAGPATLAVTIRAVRYDATEGQDIVVTAAGNVTVPAASETLAVADRGGLGADSLQSYEWDINDRLTAVESTTAVPAADRRRVAFAYDYQGRRVSKKVYTWNAGTTSWDLTTDTRFVYDGWNLLAEFAVPPSGSPTLQRTYLWGLDLGGLRTGTPGQQAGGIGGLIAVTEWSGTPLAPSSALYAVADGNGNIALLVDADSAAGAVETTEHEPFGRVVARHRADAGAMPAGAGSLCPFGFGTKYLDPETGLQYFGYRYLSPDLGRWLCRDPLGEKGGANLFAYCQNDPVNRIDPLGLRSPEEVLRLLQGSPDVRVRLMEALVSSCPVNDRQGTDPTAFFTSDYRNLAKWDAGRRAWGRGDPAPQKERVGTLGVGEGVLTWGGAEPGTQREGLALPHRTVYASTEIDWHTHPHGWHRTVVVGYPDPLTGQSFQVPPQAPNNSADGDRRVAFLARADHLVIGPTMVWFAEWKPTEGEMRWVRLGKPSEILSVHPAGGGPANVEKGADR